MSKQNATRINTTQGYRIAYRVGWGYRVEGKLYHQSQVLFHIVTIINVQIQRKRKKKEVATKKWYR
jgi:hypothetical protein